MRRQLIIIVFIVFLVFSGSVHGINPICSYPSVEVLLSVVLPTVPVSFSVPPTLLREEVRILLSMETLVVLMSMEASIVASKLGIIFPHFVVKTAETVLFVRASIISRVIALVLLHRQVSILLSRNVLSSHGVVVTTKLIVALLVKVVALRIKEIATRKDVEIVLVIFTRSVLDFLSCVLLHSRDSFDWFARDTILRLVLHVNRIKMLYSRWQTWTILLESIQFLWR